MQKCVRATFAMRWSVLFVGFSMLTIGRTQHSPPAEVLSNQIQSVFNQHDRLLSLVGVQGQGQSPLVQNGHSPRTLFDWSLPGQNLATNDLGVSFPVQPTIETATRRVTFPTTPRPTFLATVAPTIVQQQESFVPPSPLGFPFTGNFSWPTFGPSSQSLGVHAVPSVPLSLSPGSVSVSSAGTLATTPSPAVSVISSLRRRVADGAIRLVGGHGPHEGNVEVFNLGKWGSVCDDEWDIREAQVVCRQLGYPGAVQQTIDSHFGQSRKRIWMDNMFCYGDEKNLTDCPFDGWGVHDCTNAEAAGVICRTDDLEVPPATAALFPSVQPSTPVPSVFPQAIAHPQSLPSAALLSNPTNATIALATRRVDEELSGDTPKLRIRHAMTGPMQVRLVGGRIREEGRVEVRFGEGPWGTICGDGWGMFEAMTTCRMLGLGHAQAAVQSSFFGGHHLPMVLSGVACSGRDLSLADCNHDRMGAVFCPGSPENIAGVICTDVLADLVPDHLEIERSAYLEDRQLFFLQCAMEENCLARSAYRYDTSVYGWQLEVRRLLRFTARIANVGTADFRPFIPKHLWQWHMCHMHYHSMEVFAHFDVIDNRGVKVAEGHKASFCLEDNQCQPGVQPKYVCANYGDQGISVGCTDIYMHTVDCQWIDITDVKPGVYFLKVSINPEFKVPEISYENNAALCNLYYNSVQVHIWNCTLVRP